MALLECWKQYCGTVTSRVSFPPERRVTSAIPCSWGKCKSSVYSDYYPKYLFVHFGEDCSDPECILPHPKFPARSVYTMAGREVYILCSRCFSKKYDVEEKKRTYSKLPWDESLLNPGRKFQDMTVWRKITVKGRYQKTKSARGPPADAQSSAE